MLHELEIASGGDLPPRLLALVGRIEEIYRVGRVNNFITPENPLTDKDLCEQLMRERDIKVTGIDMRAIRHYLRLKRIPIASSGRGQFLALTPDELKQTLENIGRRITALKNIEYGLLEAVMKPEVQGGQIPLSF